MPAIQKRRATVAAAFFAMLIAVLPFAAPAAAQDWQNRLPLQGDPTQRAAERERLFSALASAQSQGDAETIAFQIWALWFRAPSAEARDLMDRAMERRRTYDIAGAIAILDKLVALTPDWAEAWNQRATMRYMTEDYEGSLADIERVLQLEPKHFGALAGQALILMRNGRFDTAQSVLRRAVEINPFLAERALLIEEPKPDGKDI
jgi:tetratricopeptide (TPR) repeat protein